jgi:hypothetical protein
MLIELLPRVKLLQFNLFIFKFTDEQIAKFKNSSEIEIGIDHAEYSHTTKLAGATIKSLSADFN